LFDRPARAGGAIIEALIIIGGVLWRGPSARGRALRDLRGH
jgi:hypothetical protein